MDYSHYRFLKKIKRNGHSSLSSSEEPVRFLMKQGYLDFKYNEQEYFVTEAGKDAMSEFRSSRVVPWIALLISIVSIIISVSTK